MIYFRASIEAVVRERLAADLAAGCQAAGLATAERARLAAGLAAAIDRHPLAFVGVVDRRVLTDAAVIAELAGTLHGSDLSLHEPGDESVSAAVEALLLRHP